jgi:hypothetical protein
MSTCYCQCDSSEEEISSCYCDSLEEEGAGSSRPSPLDYFDDDQSDEEEGMEENSS